MPMPPPDVRLRKRVAGEFVQEAFVVSEKH
ncbi:hypothetical protein CCACVL1_12075 [Corchorus capsularis]|uniref:Uncharacterized protein n=1 Tax=Corchorus capsularis TaxID=210143 RepID=A0A1R3IHV4_COCAP|nr:hypothetical protein CCACVL1_12075 [Corchorus capsularis]